MRLLGFEIRGAGVTIISTKFIANIIDLCSGLGVTAVFIAVVLGFPASWKAKLIGLAIGYPMIFLINQIRIDDK